MLFDSCNLLLTTYYLLMYQIHHKNYKFYRLSETIYLKNRVTIHESIPCAIRILLANHKNKL